MMIRNSETRTRNADNAADADARSRRERERGPSEVGGLFYEEKGRKGRQNITVVLTLVHLPRHCSPLSPLRVGCSFPLPAYGGRRSQSVLRHSFRTRRNRTTLIALLIRFPSLPPRSLSTAVSQAEREGGHLRALKTCPEPTQAARTLQLGMPSLVCPATSSVGVDSHSVRQAEEDDGNLVSADLFPGRIELGTHSLGRMEDRMPRAEQLLRSLSRSPCVVQPVPSSREGEQTVMGRQKNGSLRDRILNR